MVAVLWLVWRVVWSVVRREWGVEASDEWHRDTWNCHSNRHPSCKCKCNCCKCNWNWPGRLLLPGGAPGIALSALPYTRERVLGQVEGEGPGKVQLHTHTCRDAHAPGREALCGFCGETGRRVGGRGLLVRCASLAVRPALCMRTGRHCIGLRCAVLCCVLWHDGLGWTGLAWPGPAWPGLAGFCWVLLDGVLGARPQWAGLGWAGPGWAGGRVHCEFTGHWAQPAFPPTANPLLVRARVTADGDAVSRWPKAGAGEGRLHHSALALPSWPPAPMHPPTERSWSGRVGAWKCGTLPPQPTGVGTAFRMLLPPFPLIPASTTPPAHRRPTDVGD